MRLRAGGDLVSSYVVAAAHIDVLVLAAQRAGLITAGQARQLGQDLLAENTASVNWCYKEHEPVPAYAPAICRVALDPAAVVVAIDCYQYNAGEHPGWELSRAHLLTTELRPRLIAEHGPGIDRDSPRYVAAPWGVDHPVQATSMSRGARLELLTSGALVAVDPTLATEAGVRLPLALTSAAWADCVQWNDTIEAGKPAGTGQDRTGRLWDVLWVGAAAMRGAIAAAERLLGTGGGAAPPFTSFEVYRVPAGGRGVRARPVRLVVSCGPGDDGEPVLTISLVAEGPWRGGHPGGAEGT